MYLPKPKPKKNIRKCNFNAFHILACNLPGNKTFLEQIWGDFPSYITRNLGIGSAAPEKSLYLLNKTMICIERITSFLKSILMKTIPDTNNLLCTKIFWNTEYYHLDSKVKR